MQRIPLLKDSHNHLYIYSSLMDALDISGETDKNRALNRIKDYCQEREVSVVVGWSNSKFTLNSSDLDGLSAVVVCNSTLHGFIVNKEAASLLKDYSEDVMKNINNPYWMERHIYKVMGFISFITGFNSNRVDKMSHYLLSRGIYEMEDMYAANEEYIKYLIQSGLSSRVKVWSGLEEFYKLSDVGKEAVKGIKFFTDGALGTQTAALKKGFLSGDKGVLIWSDDELGEMFERAVAVKSNVAVHSLGDKAIEQVLRVYKQLKGRKEITLRMEHSLLIDSDQAEVAKDLGVILSMQPNFSKDTVKYKDRLDSEYLNRICPFRMLIDDIGFVPGKDLILGSDGMPHGFKPALNYSLFPPLKSQTLTLEEFVAGYCISGMEKGHIRVSISNAELKAEGEVVLL